MTKIDIIHSWYLNWLEEHNCKLIQRERAYPTAIIAAKVFDLSQKQMIMAFGKSTLWLFGVDRWFDEMIYTESDLLKKLKDVLSVLKNKSLNDIEKENLELSSTLLDLYHSNSNSLYYDSLFITELYSTLFVGMLHEHRIRFGKINLDQAINQYLFYGGYSIGVRFVNTAVLRTSSNLVSEDLLETILRVNSLSSDVIRLANDKVTASKEKKEGNQNFYSLFPEMNKNLTIMIDEKRKELIQLTRDQVNDENDFLNYVSTLVKVTLEFYGESDFYDENSILKQKYDDGK